MIGIYKITNLITGRSYIGQSLDIENRFREHLNHLSGSNIDKNLGLWGRYYSDIPVYDKRNKRWK